MDVGSEAAPGEAEGGSGRGKEDGSVLEPKSGPGGHSSILAAQSLFFFFFLFLLHNAKHDGGAGPCPPLTNPNTWRHFSTLGTLGEGGALQESARGGA